MSDDTVAIRFVEQLKESNTTNVTIFVGKRKPDSDPYIIPKVVLANASPYFNKIVNCDFREGRSGVLNFPEDSQDSWTLFLYWLFLRELPDPPRSTQANPRPMGPRALGPYFSVLIKAWVLGDKYDVPAFQNSIIFRMIRTFEISFPAMETVIEVFKTTPSSCSLRKLIVEELIVAVLKLRILSWKDIEPFSKLEGFFPLFMECHQEFYAQPQNYPRHNYGRNSREMEKYLLEEDRDLESEVQSMLREHGQA